VEAALLWLGAAGGGKGLGEQPLPHCDADGETVADTAAAFGLPCRPIRFHYTTNARGYRNPPDRDAGDVYCLGDSCLVGPALDWPDTLVHRLEQQLSRPCVNVALIGLAPQEVQAEFARAVAGQDLRGRVVLQFLCEDNDLLDSARVTGAAGPARAPSIWQRS